MTPLDLISFQNQKLGFSASQVWTIKWYYIHFWSLLEWCSNYWPSPQFNLEIIAHNISQVLQLLLLLLPPLLILSVSIYSLSYIVYIHGYFCRWLLLCFSGCSLGPIFWILKLYQPYFSPHLDQNLDTKDWLEMCLSWCMSWQVRRAWHSSGKVGVPGVFLWWGGWSRLEV